MELHDVLNGKNEDYECRGVSCSLVLESKREVMAGDDWDLYLRSSNLSASLQKINTAGQ